MRASLIAASFASVPLLQKNVVSRSPGAMRASASASAVVMAPVAGLMPFYYRALVMDEA